MVYRNTLVPPSPSPSLFPACPAGLSFQTSRSLDLGVQSPPTESCPRGEQVFTMAATKKTSLILPLLLALVRQAFAIPVLHYNTAFLSWTWKR